MGHLPEGLDGLASREGVAVAAGCGEGLHGVASAESYVAKRFGCKRFVPLFRCSHGVDESGDGGSCP